jgi:signal transduction histidine kinase
MQNVLTLIENPPYLILFPGLTEWVIWGVLLAGLLAVVLRNWQVKLTVSRKTILSGFLFLSTVAFCTLFFGFRLPGDHMRPLPGMLMEPQAPVIMIFIVLPMLFWAGYSGISLAVLAGLLTGLFSAFWESHSLMSLVEYGLIGLLLSVFLRQNYRTWFYKAMRHPLASALLVAIISSPIYILSTFLIIQGSLPVKIDFAFTQTASLILARTGEIILAGSIAEVLYLSRVVHWYRPQNLRPSPSQASIQVRFFNRIAPFLLVMLVGLMIGDWLVAGNAARKLLEERLESTAAIAAKNLPYFMETGQNLLLDLADADLMTRTPSEMTTALSEKLRVVPYFHQLFLFDVQGKPLVGYPLETVEEIYLTREETAGIEFARNGVVIQSYTIEPWQNGQTAQLSMIAAINDENGDLQGILLGRTDLSSNPYTQPAIQAINEINISGGEGLILDEDNRIIYHPLPSLVMTEYFGTIPATAGFYQDVAADGSRTYIYFYPVAGRPWKVLLTVPLEQSQQIALDIAIPLMLLILIFSVVVIFSLRFGLRSVTRSLNHMAKEAATIASGELNYTLQNHGDDEVGHFSHSFETMRIRLKQRLEELNGLLKVTEGVARHIEVEQSIDTIMQIALSQGPDAVRVILRKENAVPGETQADKVFAAGRFAKAYAVLDRQILDMMENEDQLIIANTTRMRRLKLSQHKDKPGAVIALSLRMDETYYGVFWLGYESPRNFDVEQVKFLNVLSYHTSIAAANASLYSKAVLGRQRLEAVLRATPEPVLVIDAQKRVLLMNPAAINISGLVNPTEVDQPVEVAIKNSDLRRILLNAPANPFEFSEEISLSNGRSYDVMISPVWISEELPAGLVCTLRDITRYKQQDMMKSDFVATVSHDLRVPLSMMRGYVTMLPMVGEINEQQKEYVEKIQNSIERMIKLTHNVLNVQRIEAGIGLDLKSVDPEKIVHMVSQILTPQAIQKKIDLIYTKEPRQEDGLRLIEADADLLQQAMYNLVENAIKFTPVKGQVRVSVQVVGEDVQFIVQDTGIGIAPLDIHGIFDRKGQKTPVEGEDGVNSGYGLTIVKSIVARHHGQVWVESVLGKGSTFYLQVPRRQA